MSVVTDAPGRYILLDVGDGYDASRITLPGFRRRLLEHLGSPVFIGLPAKDLLICWSSDLLDQAAMIRTVRVAAETLPYPLSRRIYRLTEEEFGLQPGLAGAPVIDDPDGSKAPA